jgi:hypothetical protein
MAEAVYILCAATSLVCAILLARGYQRTRARLLLWSSLCFAGLVVNNLLLIVDFVVFKEADLTLWRTASALPALGVLLYGLIWDAR